jgi:hypothetical protein
MKYQQTPVNEEAVVNFKNVDLYDAFCITG